MVVDKRADLGDPGRDDGFGHGLVDAAVAAREARARGGLTTDSAPILTVRRKTVTRMQPIHRPTG